jgi:hypothetical protein
MIALTGAAPRHDPRSVVADHNGLLSPERCDQPVDVGAHILLLAPRIPVLGKPMHRGGLHRPAPRKAGRHWSRSFAGRASYRSLRIGIAGHHRSKRRGRDPVSASLRRRSRPVATNPLSSSSASRGQAGPQGAWCEQSSAAPRAARNRRRDGALLRARRRLRAAAGPGRGWAAG